MRQFKDSIIVFNKYKLEVSMNTLIKQGQTTKISKILPDQGSSQSGEEGVAPLSEAKLF